MRYLFLLNPTAGKRDCTAELAPAIQAAAQRAGGEVDIDLMQTDLGLSATICAAGLDAQVAYGIPQFRRIPFCGG